MPKEITDPNLINEFNAKQADTPTKSSGPREITDPNLIKEFDTPPGTTKTAQDPPAGQTAYDDPNLPWYWRVYGGAARASGRIGVNAAEALLSGGKDTPNDLIKRGIKAIPGVAGAIKREKDFVNYRSDDWAENVGEGAPGAVLSLIPGGGVVENATLGGLAGYLQSRPGSRGAATVGGVLGGTLLPGVTEIIGRHPIISGVLVNEVLRDLGLSHHVGYLAGYEGAALLARLLGHFGPAGMGAFAGQIAERPEMQQMLQELKQLYDSSSASGPDRIEQ